MTRQPPEHQPPEHQPLRCQPSTRAIRVNKGRSERYRIFLLTCWLEEDDVQGDPEKWRFRFEEPRSEMRKGCIGAQRLVDLLRYELADAVVLTDGKSSSTK